MGEKMPDPDEIEARESLSKLRTLCKRISVVLIIALVILCISWLFAISSMVISQISRETVNVRNDLTTLNIAMYLVHAIIIVALFSILVRIFFSAAKGESPFTMNQVRRLRMISALLLAYALVDLGISCNNTLIQLDLMNYGYVSTSDSAIVPLNLGPFLAAAVVFAFSFVFKYGVLLQEFSDDVI